MEQSGLAAGEVLMTTDLLNYHVYFNVIYLWDWLFTDTFHDDPGNKTEELFKLILVRYSKWP